MLVRTVIALATLVAAAAASASEIPDPGLAYTVSGLAAGDRLNVRSAAGPAEPVAGTLAAGTKVVMTGRRQSVPAASGGRAGAWWEVVFAGAERGTGWVNAQFLAAAGDQSETGYPLVCTGTEPFWNLAISTGQATFTEPGQDPGKTYQAGSWLPARGMSSQFAIRLEDGGRLSGFMSVIREPHCSDGMSDTVYPFAGTLIFTDGRVLGGCCSRAR
jgi:uncharacterized membrane protein